MINEKIIKLALDANLINYVDLETPRNYFIDGYADLENVQKFAELIIKECGKVADNSVDHGIPSVYIDKHFGVD